MAVITVAVQLVASPGPVGAVSQSPFGGEDFYEGPVFDATVADFDRNGWPDVLVIESGGIAIRFNDGAGRLSEQRRFEVGPVSAIAAADIDGDGWQDIVFTGGGEVGVIMAHEESFDSPEYLPAGEAPSSIAIGDVDSDGRLDLVIASGNQFHVYLGRGDGKFGARPLATGLIPCSLPCDALGWSRLHIADMNGDGRSDLFAAPILLANEHGTNQRFGIYMFPGLGDGRFAVGPFLDIGGCAAAPADFDGDGWTDIAVTTGDDWIAILWNDQSGGLGFVDRDTLQQGMTWWPQAGAQAPSPDDDVTGGIFGMSIIVSDLNGDGSVDVIANNWAGQYVTRLVWYLNRSGRHFTVAPPPFVRRTHPSCCAADQITLVVAADIDCDGSNDVISLRGPFGPEDHTSLGVLRHAHPEAFRVMSELPIPKEDYGLPLHLLGRFFPVTLLGNGRLEMLQPAADQLIHWTFDEEGRLQRSGDIHVQGEIVEVADVDDDGLTDLVMAREGGLEIVHMGPEGPDAVERWSNTLLTRLGRFDDHPSIDMLVRDASGTPSLLLNDGAGHFVRIPIQIDEEVEELARAGAGDLDGDGRGEIVVRHRGDWSGELPSDTIVVFANRGSGRFDRSMSLRMSAIADYGLASQIRIADLDADQSPEIVVISAGHGGLRILDPKHGSERVYYTQETYGLNPSSISIADFDLDGRLDLAFVSDLDSNTGHLTVVCDPMSVEPMREDRLVQGMVWARSVVTGDADGNGTTDIVVGVGRYDYEGGENSTGASILFNVLSPSSARAPLGIASTPAQRPTLGLSPNPTWGDATLRLGVSVPGAVRIELFDLTGRRVHDETLTLAGGTHAIRLSPSRDLPAGLYLVRALTGGQSVVARLAILR